MEDKPVVTVAEVGPWPPVSGDSGGGGAVAVAEEAPPQLDGFKLLAPLGQGGMGSVWRAVQLSSNRPVALKLLRGSFFGARRARARFEREVDLLARLEHPHIARLYHSGVLGSTPYFAMELVEGQPLDEYVQGQALSRQATLRLFIQVCRAVDYAHRRGVIHRDLKPSNILVDTQGEPRVLDFGLGKSLDDAVAAETQTALTIDGAAAGTPLYMSPEQATGEHDRVDTRSDVYSLGVVLFQLLTGGFPHGPAPTRYALQRSIVEEEPRRPRSVSREVDAELEAVLLKALAKHPEERYASPADLAQDLEHYLRGEPLRARPLTIRYVLRKRLVRHRVPVALALAAMLVIFAGVTSSYLAIASARARAERHAEQAEHALYINRLALAQAAVAAGDGDRAAAVLKSCPPERRGWEWSHLRLLADPSELHLTDVDVRAVALSADGRLVQALTPDLHTLARWDARTGAPLSPIELPAGTRHARFSDDGRYLICVGEASPTLIDTAADGARIDLAVLGPAVRGDVAPGGRAVAVVDADDRVHVWLAETGQVQRAGLAIPNFSHFAVTMDGGVVCIGGERLAFHAPDALDRPRQVTMGGDPSSLALSPDGERLAVGDREGRVVVYTLPALERVGDVTVRPGRRVETVRWDPGGERLFAAVQQAGVAMIDARSATALGFLGGPGDVRDLHPGPDGRLVTHGHDWIRVTPLASAPMQRWATPTELFYGYQSALTLASDGAVMVANGVGEVVRVDRAGTGTVLNPGMAPPTDLQFLAVGWSAEREAALAFSSAGELLVRRGEAAWRVEPLPVTRPRFASFSADGRWLAIQPPNADLVVVDLTDPDRRLRPLPGRFPIAFAADGPQMAFIDLDGALWWVDLTADEPQPLGVALEGVISAVALSGDGHTAAAATLKGEVVIASRRPVERAGDRPAAVRLDLGRQTTDLALDRDGRRLLAGTDGLPVLDTRTGDRLIDLLPDEPHQLQSVELSPEGDRVVVATNMGVRLIGVLPARTTQLAGLH